jgi:hypothetical protein
MKDKFYKLMEQAGYRTWTGRWEWEEIIFDLAIVGIVVVAVGALIWIL